ncbi:MAG: phage tail tape measure protein, partial [Firmicutes bacterium]|nr:phage tail tape measure protein [Bacillota bacterium]
MADGSLVFDTKLDSTGLQKGLAGVGSIAKTSIRAMATAMVAAGAAVAAGVAASIQYGKEYETSMAKVQTMFGDVDVDMDNLNQKMLALSSDTGLAATELGQAMYSALSAGIPVTEDMTEATGFLEGAVKLAKAGFTDVDTAVSATAKTLNAYNLDVSEAERIQGILMATQNNGITTVGELGATLAQVTPVAAAMGVEFEYVGAALATMTAQGTPTAQATTQLKTLFAELGKNGTIAAKSLDKAVKGTAYAGMSFTDMTEAGVPLNDILNLMTEYADANSLSVVDMFGSIEAGQAVLALTGESAETFSKNIEAMGNTAGLVDSAYTTMMDTLEGQTGRLTESAKNLGISIYNGMSGKLTDMAGLANDYIAELQAGFDEGGTEGLVTALGDVLADMIAQVAAGLPSVVTIVTGLLDALVTSLSEEDNKTKIATGLADAVEAAFTLAESVPDLVDAGLDIMTELVTQIAANADTTAPKIIQAISDTLLTLVEHAPEL